MAIIERQQDVIRRLERVVDELLETNTRAIELLREPPVNTATIQAAATHVINGWYRFKGDKDMDIRISELERAIDRGEEA